MKAIIMSIRPEWVAKILNGEKTIEIRKTIPKCELPVDVYIYCTKQIPSFRIADTPAGIMCLYPYFPDGESRFGGKVIAKFTLRKVEDLRGINSSDGFSILDRACLDYDEFIDYLYKGREGAYAWYISDLVFYAKPKELNEFVKELKFHESCEVCPHDCKHEAVLRDCSYDVPLKRPPQSWCYVEVEE